MGSFDQIDHSWMIKFVEHRIGDRRIVRLIQKWLKAGVMEQGQGAETKEGSPQGAVISPLLANLYPLCFQKHKRYNAECIVTRSLSRTDRVGQSF